MDPTPGAEIPLDTPPTTPAQDYGEWQVDGAIRQRWIEDATDGSCEITPSTLTVDDLEDMGYHVDFDYGISIFPYTLSEDVASLDYFPRPHVHCKAWSDTIEHPDSERNTFELIVGTRLVIADAIFRYDGLQFSQVAIAMLRKVMNPQRLRHVYFADIVNEDTKDFFKSMLYTERNMLQWPPVGGTKFVWAYNTPQYQGLLGTRIGKCAAYLVLEAFPRGTHYIARILTWDHNASIQMRFDIEPIPAPATAA
ncbi:hypothetical protein N7535_003431 [Penicillium sp. DV-2018c]|nr:hypothetical protein N7461_000872 [Penicillium sp. DV-2018c]KAJ5576505.1 hypothetical protein N7535_003431 [Penicillium sp. DV-2018c]